MDVQAYLLLCVVLLGLALGSRLFERAYLTVPIAALAAGFGLHLTGIVPSVADRSLLEVVAEATLAVVLFADASRLDVPCLRRDASRIAQLLLIGLPLALVLGFGWLAPFLHGWPWLEVLLLAALLVPTDAALGASLFSNPAVPERLRDTLLVESGLNDGLLLPAIIFIGCAAVGFQHDLAGVNWVTFSLTQVFGGLGIGIVTGALVGAALALAARRGLDEDWLSTAAILTVPIAYFGADALGGSSLVACFVAGLAFSFAAARFDRGDTEVTSLAHRFIETDGQLMMLIAFVYVGAVLLPLGLAQLTVSAIVIVLGSLFVVRPLAVWLSLVGTDTSWRERLLIGWFGPRGLSTALFAVFALEQFDLLREGEAILAITALAVAISAVLHGVSAHFAGTLAPRND